MTINSDWYTANYLHAAEYATLIVKATVYNKPLCSIDLKKIGRLYFLKFPGQFDIFRDAGTKYQNLGLSRTIRDVWHVCVTTMNTHVKYESCIIYHSKVMASVEVFAWIQTNI